MAEKQRIDDDFPAAQHDPLYLWGILGHVRDPDADQHRSFQLRDLYRDQYRRYSVRLPGASDARKGAGGVVFALFLPLCAVD